MAHSHNVHIANCHSSLHNLYASLLSYEGISWTPFSSVRFQLSSSSLDSQQPYFRNTRGSLSF